MVLNLNFPKKNTISTAQRNGENFRPLRGSNYAVTNVEKYSDISVDFLVCVITIFSIYTKLYSFLDVRVSASRVGGHVFWGFTVNLLANDNYKMWHIF